MKKLLKPLSLAMSALLLVGSLTACAKTPTPDEIYTLVDEAESAQMVVEMEFAELMTTTMTVEGEGDKSHVVIEMDVMGSSTEEESYMERVDGKIYTYTKGVGDKWVKTETDEDADDTSIDGFKELFNTENYLEYDKETRRYVMKDDTIVDWDDMTCSEGYIEVGEDGTFTLFVKLAQTAEGTAFSGTLTLTISKIGEVTVTLPEAE